MLESSRLRFCNFPIFCLVPMCLAPFRGMVLAMSKMVGNRICVSFFVPFVFLLLCMLYSSYVMCGCGYFSVFIKIYLFYLFILFIYLFIYSYFSEKWFEFTLSLPTLFWRDNQFKAFQILKCFSSVDSADWASGIFVQFSCLQKNRRLTSPLGLQRIFLI